MDTYRVIVDRDLDDLVPSFLSTRQKDMATLKIAISEGDTQRIAKIGHNIKGVAGSYGFIDLSAMGAELQIAAESENGSRCEELLGRMIHYLEKVDITYV